MRVRNVGGIILVIIGLIPFGKLYFSTSKEIPGEKKAAVAQPETT